MERLVDMAVGEGAAAAPPSNGKGRMSMASTAPEEPRGQAAGPVRRATVCMCALGRVIERRADHLKRR